MKMMRSVRYAVIAAVVALAVGNSAFAAVILAKSDNILGADTGAKIYEFAIGTAGDYKASLFDLGTPDTFSLLSMVISPTGGDKLGSVTIPPSTSPASFSFHAGIGDYTLQVFGKPGEIHAGSFSVKVETVPGIGGVDTPSPTAVPEPTSWLMLIAGIGLLGAVSLRNRNSA
jgi:hypothetical protein